MNLIKFSTSWCGKCRQIKSQFDELENDFNLVEYDCDNCDESLLEKYEVKDLPTIILEDNGEIVSKWNGNQKLKDWLGVD